MVKVNLLKYSFFIGLMSASSLCLGDVSQTFSAIKKDPNALYAFLKEMPKGGELHYHLAGGAYPETMLAIAARADYCLNPDTWVMTRDGDCKGIKAQEVPKLPALYEKTVRAWSMKNFIAGQESGHDHFFASFFKFMSIVSENTVSLLAEVMERAADQHEQYMEIMILPDNAKSTAIVNLDGLAKNYTQLKEQLLANKEFSAEIDKTVASAEALLPEARLALGCDSSPQKEVCQLTVRFQYYVLREQPLDKLFAQALHAFTAASRSKALVGVNLVQPEDGIISLRDYHQQMKIFDFMHQVYPHVPIALHAGELAPSNVLREDLRFHINEAVKIGHAQRIGHGVDIGFENDANDLVQYMAKNHIAVEINLISNKKILEISGSNHPLCFYLANHVPVVLSTDDEGILRTDLTEQYVEAVMHHALNYPTIKQINRNALTYSFLPGKSLWVDAEKALLVSQCSDLNSKTCLDFANGNEKARVQRQLELKLADFEQRF